MTKKNHRNFWLKFDIFWRSLTKSHSIVASFTCLLLMKPWLWKLLTVPRWCRTCAHWIKEHRKFLLKKKFSSKFLTQIWLFQRSQYEKISPLANFVCQKKFWDVLSKIRFHSFVGLDLENRLSTHNMVISIELKAKKSFWWKNQKTFFECPFEIIGFTCWPKFFVENKAPSLL